LSLFILVASIDDAHDHHRARRESITLPTERSVVTERHRDDAPSVSRDVLDAVTGCVAFFSSHATHLVDAHSRPVLVLPSRRRTTVGRIGDYFK